jgi:hypothetical protein
MQALIPAQVMDVVLVCKAKRQGQIADLAGLADAVNALARLDARQRRIVKLRFSAASPSRKPRRYRTFRRPR